MGLLTRFELIVYESHGPLQHHCPPYDCNPFGCCFFLLCSYWVEHTVFWRPDRNQVGLPLNKRSFCDFCPSTRRCEACVVPSQFRRLCQPLRRRRAHCLAWWVSPQPPPVTSPCSLLADLPTDAMPPMVMTNTINSLMKRKGAFYKAVPRWCRSRSLLMNAPRPSCGCSARGRCCSF